MFSHLSKLTFDPTFFLQPRMLLEDRLKKEMEMHQKNMSSNKRPAFDDVMSPTTEEEQQSWNMLQKQISSCSQDASELVASCDSVLQKGFLDKCKLSSLAAVSKKWKRCFFVLKARDQILYCFEDTNLVSIIIIIIFVKFIC